MLSPQLLFRRGAAFTSCLLKAPRCFSTTGACANIRNYEALIKGTTFSPLPNLFPYNPTLLITPLRKTIIDPALPLVSPSILPGLTFAVKFDPLPQLNEVQAPPFQKIEKQAARMVVIRKRKMKKHKLKKLRKKMKYVYIKVNQRRKLKKEKAFQDQLMAQISEAEQFDPKSYVERFIQEAKEEIDLSRKIVNLNKRNPARYSADGTKLVTMSKASRK